MKTIEASATTTGSRDDVWALLADASKWSEWGAWSEVGVEDGGPQEPGKIRYLVRKPYRLRERVTDWEPGRKMGYELVEGMKLENYRATITLEDAPGGGTVVHWRSAYDRGGLLTGLIVRSAVKDACKRVAKAAEKAS